MAYGAEPVRGDCLTHTIYIWPSRQLVAGSSYWPESWHEAFEQATSQLGSVVASYVLGGLPVTRQPITMELPVGSIRFSVECRDTSIYIAVSDFEGPEDPGPDAPGPNGGMRRRPSPADGLILGLRGTGKSFTVVTFYGPLPPIPAGYRLPSETTDRAFSFEGMGARGAGSLVGSIGRMSSSRAAIAPASGIVLPRRPAFARRTPSRSGPIVEMVHDDSVCDPQSYRIDAANNKNALFSQTKDPIDWSLQRAETPSR